jgi:hypothetical protein
MKPLTEWTDEELWDRITDLDHRREYMGELLRRERDRCAGECASVAAETYSDRDEIARECEQRIRGLQ